jgi:WhiB family transcriptional regulator, redox-sensing transcriptional regulator
VTDITEFIQADRNRIRGLRPPLDGGARYAAASLTWMSRGACQGEDPELFFPIAAEGPALLQINTAKAVCRGCAVAAACLAYALQTRQAGIWGGTTQEERRAMTAQIRWSTHEQTDRLTTDSHSHTPPRRA